MTMIDVPNGSKHKAEAFAYVNEILDPMFQLGLAIEMSYGPTNKLLAPILEGYPEMSKKFPASPVDLDNFGQSTGMCSIRNCRKPSTCGTGRFCRSDGALEAAS